MTAPAIVKQPTSRIRASERSLTIALKAMQDAGLSVDKLCISGGKIEIHCVPVVENHPAKNDGGLKDW